MTKLKYMHIYVIYVLQVYKLHICIILYQVARYISSALGKYVVS